MSQSNSLLGGGIHLAVQQQMQSLMANAGYPGAYAPGQFPVGDPGMLHRSQTHDKHILPADRSAAVTLPGNTLRVCTYFATFASSHGALSGHPACNGSSCIQQWFWWTFSDAREMGVKIDGLVVMSSFRCADCQQGLAISSLRAIGVCPPPWIPSPTRCCQTSLEDWAPPTEWPLEMQV